MKTSTILINADNIIHQPSTGIIMNGRYGNYAIINGCNRSLKSAKSNGYREITLPNDIVRALIAAESAHTQLLIKERQCKDDASRAECVDACLKCAPIEISCKIGELCPTANLSGTDMISQYKGCGKGTAYVNECNQVVAFHYGYRRPYAAHHILDNCRAIRCELSSTQICFF